MTELHAEVLDKKPLKLEPHLLNDSVEMIASEKPDTTVPPYLTFSKYANCSELKTMPRLYPIALSDVLQHVFCASPSLKQAIKSVDEKQAGVDLAQTAFRPRLNANAEFATDRIPSSNSGAGSLNRSVTGSINLSWVLFDFGTRDANLLQARYVLSAAFASQENATMSAMVEALRVYTLALTAYGKLNALKEAEANATQSLTVAQARYEAKVGGLAEKLQAQTALAQAKLERSRANGNWITARGALATMMGFNIDTPLALADIQTAFPSVNRQPQFDVLMDEIKTNHPRIRAVQAEIASMRARLNAIQSEYKGSVSLSSNAAQTKALGNNADNTLDQNVNISLQANIPLFAGKEQAAREAQVAAQIAMRDAQIEQIQNEISNEVWSNTQQTITETENLVASQQLLESAKQNYQIALGRYQAGVGSILDLLLAQTTLAKAEEQLQESNINNMQARIRLAFVAGRISTQYQKYAE